jgi:hypothetical protein
MRFNRLTDLYARRILRNVSPEGQRKHEKARQFAPILPDFSTSLHPNNRRVRLLLLNPAQLAKASITS